MGNALLREYRIEYIIKLVNTEILAIENECKYYICDTLG